MTSVNPHTSQLDDQVPRRDPEWTGELGRDVLPKSGYWTLLGLYGAGTASLLYWAARNDCLLEEVNWADLFVLAGGTQKLATTLTKERITTVIRQPFTDYHGTEGALPGETNESIRRDGGNLRQAIGELLCCPYCASTWSATALFGAYMANRRLGRTLGMLLSSVSLAEVAQRMYRKALD